VFGERALALGKCCPGSTDCRVFPVALGISVNDVGGRRLVRSGADSPQSHASTWGIRRSWPPGTRMIARRELPHPGAHQLHRRGRLSLAGLVTDLPDPDICYLEALFRGRGRIECGIRDAKDTGLANLPSHSFAINAAWIATFMIACELLAWTKKLCLDGKLAKAEPKGLRHTLFHAAGLLVCSARRKSVRIASGWPWADDLVDAFGRLPSRATVT
jgi:Transposase DDE domain group 1